MSRKIQLSMMLCATAAFFISPSVLTADEKTIEKTRPADVAEASLPPATGEWNQWRGPDRANKSPETNLLTEWPEEGPPLAWRAEGLGEGIASVSIADGQIFTMTYANDLEFLVALDQATGNLRWAAPVGSAVQEQRLMRWLSQRSPTLDGDRLYALTGHGILVHLPEEPSRVTEFEDRRPSSDSSVFVPTPQDVVEKMLELANVKESDRVYDLGSGDGRIVVTAAQKYGSHSIGYELDEDLVAVSRAAVRKEGVEELVLIEQEDIYNVDLSEADVVAVYLLPKQLEKLIPQFEKLPAGARIVSHYFKIPEIEPEQSETIRSEEDGASHRVYLYQAPLKK